MEYSFSTAHYRVQISCEPWEKSIGPFYHPYMCTRGRFGWSSWIEMFQNNTFYTLNANTTNSKTSLLVRTFPPITTKFFSRYTEPVYTYHGVLLTLNTYVSFCTPCAVFYIHKFHIFTRLCVRDRDVKRIRLADVCI